VPHVFLASPRGIVRSPRGVRTGPCGVHTGPCGLPGGQLGLGSCVTVRAESAQSPCGVRAFGLGHSDTTRTVRTNFSFARTRTG